MASSAEELERIKLANESVDSDLIKEAEGVYSELMGSYPVALGKSASKKEREEREITKNGNLVYGEVTFETLAIVIEKIKKFYGLPNIGSSGSEGVLQSKGGAFYDLGAGTGKPCIIAALMHNFDVCCGVEMLEGLYAVSQDVANTYSTRGKTHQFTASREFQTHVSFVHGDILNMKLKDWRDGDVVFINSTCFDDPLMDRISNLALGMRRGTFVISLTRRLSNNDFAVIESEMYKMSWGEATVFISQKITDPRYVGADAMAAGGGESSEDD